MHNVQRPVQRRHEPRIRFHNQSLVLICRPNLVVINILKLIQILDMCWLLARLWALGIYEINKMF